MQEEKLVGSLLFWYLICIMVGIITCCWQMFRGQKFFWHCSWDCSSLRVCGISVSYTHLEPYTSDLPEKKELLASIRAKEVLVAMEDDKMLGFLRFGPEKKVSVLWQVAVKEEARGKGIGKMLVKHWFWQVKDSALRCQLWVRTDNPSAQRMYEMLGFLPDGRIAPVMIKEKKG